MFYGHFSARGRLNGPSDLRGSEAKSKMKQPSYMPAPRFEHDGSDLWPNALLSIHYDFKHTYDDGSEMKNKSP